MKLWSEVVIRVQWFVSEQIRLIGELETATGCVSRTSVHIIAVVLLQFGLVVADLVYALNFGPPPTPWSNSKQNTWIKRARRKLPKSTRALTIVRSRGSFRVLRKSSNYLGDLWAWTRCMFVHCTQFTHSSDRKRNQFEENQ